MDYKISRGKKKASLSSSSSRRTSRLKKNLDNQVKIYKKASDSDKSIKVIMYFSDSELQRVMDILKRLKLTACKDVVLIDASPEESASKAQSS